MASMWVAGSPDVTFSIYLTHASSGNPRRAPTPQLQHTAQRGASRCSSCPSNSRGGPARPCLRRRALEGSGDQLQEPLASVPEPEDSKGAIAVGLQQFNSGNYTEALVTFEKALTLPGTGVKQFRDKPAIVSPGEKQAALYNMACCHARLGNGREGLQSLIFLLEAGYEDFEQLRIDPDLAVLRKEDQYEYVISRFKPSSPGFFGSLLKGFSG